MQTTSTKAVASLQAEVAQLRHELQTIKGSADGDSLFVGQYLIERLVQLGVTVSVLPFPFPRLYPCAKIARLIALCALTENVRRPGRLQPR